jgi:hypothetical protein
MAAAFADWKIFSDAYKNESCCSMLCSDSDPPTAIERKLLIGRFRKRTF